MKRLLITLLLTLATIATGAAQITISPTHIFVSSQTRFGSYMVINGSDEPQEISIDFGFSYVALDDEGNITVIENDSAKAATFSIAQFVRAFPKSFILQPGERQTVRLRIAAPNDLDEGMYWARINTTSSAVSPSVGSITSEGVSAQVDIKFRQNIGLFYKVGDVRTDIAIGNLETNIDKNNTLWISAKVDRAGNAPFLGTIYATIYNQQKEKVAQSVVSTTIYFDGVVTRPINVAHLPSGNYIAKIRFETQRSDIPTKLLAQMPAAASTIQFTIE